MVRKIILLRFLQLYRSSGDIGIFRALFVLVLLLPLLILFLVQRIAVHPWPLVIPASVGYITWLIHSRRKDYHFLASVMQQPRHVFAAEYILFTSPVIVLFLTKGLYFHALALTVLLLTISFIVPARATGSGRSIKLPFIPQGMFEWQGGIRKNLFALILFYIPGFLGFYHPGFSALSALLVTLVFTSFYSEYESRNMLCAGNPGPWKFLFRKIIRHTGCFSLVMLPLLAIASINPGYRLITVGYFLALMNLMVFSILLKYYQYRPSAFSGAHDVLVSMACLLSVILPVALLVAMFNLFLAAGAHNNLKTLLDDQY
jgi:hypothetical protein